MVTETVKATGNGTVTGPPSPAAKSRVFQPILCKTLWKRTVESTGACALFSHPVEISMEGAFCLFQRLHVRPARFSLQRRKKTLAIPCGLCYSISV